MKLLATLILFIILPSPLYAAGTYQAASCNFADVNAVINGPTHTLAAGDTIIIPACSSTTWTSALTITVPNSSLNTTVTTLMGQTVCTGSGDPANNNLSCKDNTTIMNNVPGNNPMINIVPPVTGEFRLTGLTMGSSVSVYHGYVNVSTPSGTGSVNPGVRIDHNHWLGANGGTGDLEFDGWEYGVVDHNIFYAISDDENMIRVYNGAYWNNATDDFGHAAWADSAYFGSNKAIYIEQNYFYSSTSGGTGYQIIEDCATGGHFVARFNTLGYHMTGYTHGTSGGSTSTRGCRALELYANNADWDSTGATTNSTGIMNAESGTGLIWGNTLAHQTYVLNEDYTRKNIGGGGYSQTAPPNGWGYCGTDESGQTTDSAWDKNANTVTGYPCLDQPGRGKGDLLEGNFPTVCDKSAGCPSYNGTWSNQALEPFYMWDNTVGTGFSAYWSNSDDHAVMSNNQDYYFPCGTYNSSCSKFTGAAGVGQGTYASMPASCTSGVAYWATDQGSWNVSGNGFGQGQLYICANTGWPAVGSPSYTPYSYPHPLTQSSGSLPAAPTNLAATVQ
jgi:hypothetical protein